MCLAVPMQVLELRDGQARCLRQGAERWVDARLVDGLASGDWVLVFIDAIRERIDAVRAAEIDAVLGLLDAALSGDFAAAAGCDPGFELPSSRHPLAFIGVSHDD